MEFTLTYKGSLKATGTPKHKQEIRRLLHVQLKELWSHPPLYDKRRGGDVPIIRMVEQFKFAPLIDNKLYLIAEIKLILLRPRFPGGIITQGGDIDNHLKTLFDAFRRPKDRTELPKGDTPNTDEKPFFCLLEDDNLITKISVETDTLLEPCNKNTSYVELLIQVRIKAVKSTYNNMGIG